MLHVLLFKQLHFYAGLLTTPAFPDFDFGVCSAVLADSNTYVASSLDIHKKYSKRQAEKQPRNITRMFLAHSLAFERTCLKVSSCWGYVTTRAKL